MDYLEVVLQGYFNENNRQYLERYFFREFKKAEKEQFFDSDEFFSGCLGVIEGWEDDLKNEVHKRKKELSLMLSGAKSGTLKYENMEGKTIEQKRQETIEYCEKEISDVRPDGIGSFSFTVHLHSLTHGRVAYNMSYNEIMNIKKAILKASIKANEAIFKAPPPQPGLFSVFEWATIFYYADETKLLSNKRAVKDRWEKFMKDHNIKTTSGHFKNNYYDAKKRLNEKNNYPIDKLKLIIPFLEENYQQAVTKVKNDISFLETEQADY